MFMENIVKVRLLTRMHTLLPCEQLNGCMLVLLCTFPVNPVCSVQSGHNLCCI